MKRITLLLAMLIASFGFSQTLLSDLGALSNSENFENSTIGANRAPCAYTQPIAGSPQGYPMGSTSLSEVAEDFDVLADQTFTPDTFITNILLTNPDTVISINIDFYQDGTGIPGGLLFSLPGQRPVSQSVIGTALGFDIIETVFDLTPSGISFDGTPTGSKYWIGISGGITLSGSNNTLADLTDTVTGVELAFNEAGNGWAPGSTVFGPARDMVMSLSGDCSLIPIAICGVGNPQPVPPTGNGGGGCLGGPTISAATITETGIIGTNFTLESVEINITHTWDADLDIWLSSPQGTVWDLSSSNGDSGDNYTNTIFSDDFPNIITGTPPFTGTFEAEQGAFRVGFDGEDIQGDWTLLICDNSTGDSGELLSYCITFSPIEGTPPVIICPADITVNTDSGICGSIVNFSDAIAIDIDGDLDTVVQTSGLPSGSLFPVGISIVEFTATDLLGNTAICIFTITVIDNENPTIVCQDITVELDSSGTITISAEDLLSDFSDNCGISSVVAGSPALPSGALTTLFAFDNGGSSAVYFDVLVGPEDLNINSIDVNTDDLGTMTIEVYTLVGTSVGNELDPTAWNTMTLGNGIGMGINTPSNMVLGVPLFLSANTNYGIAIVMDGSHWYTDGNGTNQSYSNADLSMELGSATSGPFTGTLFTPRVFNGTFNYTIGSSIGVIPQGTTVDFNCSLLGSNLLEVTVIDVHGNVSVCSSIVTVEDNIAPEIVCIGEPGILIDTDTSIPSLTISDNTTVSDILSISTSGAITDINVTLGIEHTWVGDMQITLQSPSGTQVLIFDGSTDGCSGDNINDIYDDQSINPLVCVTGGEAFPLSDYLPSNALSVFNSEDVIGDWTLFIEDTATGDTGVLNSWSLNYSYAVVSSSLEVDLDASGNVTVDADSLLLSVTEGCGWTATVPGSIGTEILPTLFAGGNHQSGNMFDIVALNDLTVDSFDISVGTGITDSYEIYFKRGPYLPSVNIPTDWILVGSGSVTSAGANIPTPLNLDLGVEMLAGETFGFYVTLTTTDAIVYTNGTTTGALFAFDTNMEFYEGHGVIYPFSTNFNPRIFNGNIHYTTLGGISTTLDFSCDDLGLNLVEVTVTDSSGNASTCIASVIVNDVTPPVLVCTDITIELDENGVATIDPEDLLAQVPGTYEVITISSDNQSNLPGDTDFTVAVTQAEAISFDWFFSTLDGPFWDTFGYLLNGTYTELTDPLGAITQSGNTSLSVEVGDIFGFRSHSEDGTTGAATTVISNFLPGFTDQFDPANWTLTLDNSDGDAYFVLIPGGPLSFDACGITTLATDVTQVSCNDIGSPVTVTVFASDASLNVATCQSIVTVVDLLPPVVTCPDDQEVLVPQADPFWEIEDYFLTGEATAVDNCTDPLEIFSQDPAVGTLLGEGVHTITLSSSDEYGNQASCSFELTVDIELGTQDNILDSSIVIYPNPAKDKVTFVNRSGISLEKATIYDLNGRVIFNVDLRDMQQEKTVDVSNLSSGVYIVQFTGDNAIAIKRLVKE